MFFSSAKAQKLYWYVVNSVHQILLILLNLTSLFHTLKSEQSTVIHRGKCDRVEWGDEGGEMYQHFCIKQTKCWHVGLL